MPSNGPVCSCRFFFLFWLKILQSFLWKLSGQSASFSFGSWWCLTAALRPAAAWSSGWRVGNRHWDWQSSFSWAGWSRNGSAVWDPHSSKRISTPASRKFWEGQSALCWTLSTCVPGDQADRCSPAVYFFWIIFEQVRCSRNRIWLSFYRFYIAIHDCSAFKALSADLCQWDTELLKKLLLSLLFNRYSCSFSACLLVCLSVWSVCLSPTLLSISSRPR